ncbi:MAG: M48 family metallopeptidase [Bacteroidota bacterium]
MKSILTGILYCLPLFCLGQVQYTYSPSSIKTSFPDNFVQNRSERFKRDLKIIPLKGKALKHQKDIFELRFDRLNERGDNGEFLYDDILEPYCQRVLDRIFLTNPSLPSQDIHLLISRSSVPNASCLGEGTIVINLGLISRLESESQLAFTLCHELAHYIQDHVNDNILNRVETYYSKETQQRLREIRNSAYNQNAKALDLLKEFAFDSHRHSRFKESEADSLGLILFSNTSYPLAGAIQLLGILQEVDQDKYGVQLDMKKYFGGLGYPLKEAYFRYEPDTTFFYSNDSFLNWDEDSMRTHPETDKRMAALARQLSSGQYDESSSPPSATPFATVSQMCDFEMILYDYSVKNFGEAMYQSLILLELYPENIFLHAMVGLCLGGLYDAKKDHRLNSVLELPTQLFSENYNQFLHFFNSIRLKELRELIYLYLHPHEEKCLTDEFCGLAYLHMARINEKAGSVLEFKGNYLKTFPQSPYRQQIDSILK